MSSTFASSLIARKPDAKVTLTTASKQGSSAPDTANPL